jgi:hypothetical protein
LRADWRGAQSTANPGLTQSLRESAKSPIDKRGGGGGGTLRGCRRQRANPN